LTELLRLFPFLALSQLFAIVDAKMVAAQVEDEKQLYFGRVFAVICVLRSGRLANLNAAERKSVVQVWLFAREQTTFYTATLTTPVLTKKRVWRTR
jgi:hypothetical protein